MLPVFPRGIRRRKTSDLGEKRASSRFPGGVIFERPDTPGGEGRDRAEKRLELVGAAMIKPAIRAPRQCRDLAEGFLGDRVRPFLKQKYRHTPEPEFPGPRAYRVDVFLHRVTDEDQRVDALLSRLDDPMTQDPADLCLTAKTANGRHVLDKGGGVVVPTAGLTFAKPPVEHELHVEAANLVSRAEHLALQAARQIPCRFTAGRCVDGDDQPAPPRGCALGRSPDGFQKSCDIVR